MSVAHDIVEDLVQNLAARKGLGNEWDEIEEDVQDVLIEDWEAIVQLHLDRVGAP